MLKDLAAWCVIVFVWYVFIMLALAVFKPGGVVFWFDGVRHTVQIK